MAKAKRFLYLPTRSGYPFVREVIVEFEWFPGFALSQARKSIAALHWKAREQGIQPVLEISSKSPDVLGIALSAFSLSLLSHHSEKSISVECAFQGSKIFEQGGPFQDLYAVTSKEARKDGRLRSSGKLIGFRFYEQDFPLQPVTAFYDWLYIHALQQNPQYAQEIGQYQGFSDIAFNPKKSFNCQAKSAALYVALERALLSERCAADFDLFLKWAQGTI